MKFLTVTISTVTEWGVKMKGKILYTVLEIAVVILLLSELFEFTVYAFSNHSSLLSEIKESSYIIVHKYFSLLSLPLFAILVAFGMKDIESRDRNILI